MLWISVVDWVTPFSLLYLYKHISSTKMVENKNINSPNNMDTVGTEKLKILLEKDENVKER